MAERNRQRSTPLGDTAARPGAAPHPAVIGGISPAPYEPPRHQDQHSTTKALCKTADAAGPADAYQRRRDPAAEIIAGSADGFVR